MGDGRDVPSAPRRLTRARSQRVRESANGDKLVVQAPEPILASGRPSADVPSTAASADESARAPTRRRALPIAEPRRADISEIPAGARVAPLAPRIDAAAEEIYDEIRSASAGASRVRA